MFFDKFKKNKLENNINEENLNDIGWQAIEQEVKRVYGIDKPYVNYAPQFPMLKWKFGGELPLEQISIYDGGDYWLFVTFGMTELYEKEEKNVEISGYGMEFTFKLKKNSSDDELELKAMSDTLQKIARYVYSGNGLIKPYQYIYSGQTHGIDAKKESKLTGFITIPDTKLNTINTPNGRVDFVELIGATDLELKSIIDKQITVKELYEKIGTDITDYTRNSVIK